MKKVLLAGGAGLVGQSLLKILEHSEFHITVVDKDANLINKLKSEFNDVKFITLDLSDGDEVKKLALSFDCIVMMQALIKGLKYFDFHQNTVISTQNLLEQIKNQKVNPYLIHVSSSVINSKADDFYTRSKREQEQLVMNSNLQKVILRPTLMYGEGDNKHFYALINLMRKFPFFPLPGNGKYIRQPLYAMDFAHVVKNCIKEPKLGIFNISGLEFITFKNCLIKFKRHYQCFSLVTPIPVFMFRLLLRIAALITKKVPFTEQQLDALIIPETFERIDWPKIFNTTYTTFDDGIRKFEYKFK